MKIAYLICAHTDPEQLNRLILALDNGENHCYIHIDGKVDIAPFIQAVGERACVTFLKKRVAVYWGGYSQVKAISSLIEAALEQYYDRLVYISGLDYPIWSNEKIAEFWEQNRDVQYCGAYNLTDSNVEIACNMVKHYAYMDIKIKNEWWFNHIRKYVNDFLRKIPRKNYINVNGKKWEIYWGSSWWALTYECAQYVYKAYKENAALRRYLKFAFPPDELWVQTILCNSGYSSQVIYSNEYDFEKVTVLQKVEYRHKIRVWEIEDYDEIVKSGKMFIRKVTSEASADLVESLDRDREKQKGCNK